MPKLFRISTSTLGLFLAAITVSPVLLASEQVKPFEISAFRSLLNPGDYGPFTQVFVAEIRDYTTQGAPTPDLFLLDNVEVIPAGAPDDSGELLFAFFKGFSSGVKQPSELGAVVFEGSDFPATSGEVPISGFLRRTGSLAAAPGAALGSFYEGSTGEFTYTGSRARRALSIELETVSEGTLSGESTLSVFSGDQVEVGGWRSDIYALNEPAFESSLLQRVDQVYYGALDRRDNPGSLAWYDRRGILIVVDSDDADGDGIPDFSDTRTSMAPFFATRELGNNWYYAPWMRAAVMGSAEQWYLTTTHRWLYAPDAQTNGVWFYSPSSDLGWFWTRDDLYPYVYQYSDRAFRYYHWEDRDGDRMAGAGEAFLYDFENDEWMEVRF